jgi:hypothetical protein
VLRAVLRAKEVRRVDDRLELSRRRGITLSPGRGAETVLAERPTEPPGPGERRQVELGASR